MRSMEISDTITVMRAGQTVDRLKTPETTPAEIAKAMVGREVVTLRAAKQRVGSLDLPRVETDSSVRRTGVCDV